MNWTIAQETWNPAGVGNHRAVISVDKPNECVRTVIPWRRRDPNPSAIGMRLFRAADNCEITNFSIISITHAEGIIEFSAEQAGDYHLYYLPYTITGQHFYFPVVNYLKTKAEDSKREPCQNAQTARVLRFESRTEHDSFYPMEVTSTPEEIHQLLAEHNNKQYLVFTEDREYSIRMFKPISGMPPIPHRWIISKPIQTFTGVARPNEYYCFQLGILAMSADLTNVQTAFKDFIGDNGSAISSSKLTNFNTDGVDWLGKPFIKQVAVPQGHIQPLWIGIDIPANAEKGTYKGEIIVSADNLPDTTVSVTLTVDGAPAPDRGDSNIKQLSTMRWLNGTAGIDDKPIKGYQPIKRDKQTLQILGRAITLGNDGFPHSIQSYFDSTITELTQTATEVLSSPIQFSLHAESPEITWTKETPDAFEWTAETTTNQWKTEMHGVLEAEGFLGYKLKVTALADTTIDDAVLTIPVNKQSAKYMCGMGFEGGARPQTWDYRWQLDYANHQVWIGDVNAGIQCKLKISDNQWDLYNLHKSGLPKSWHNEGKGGVMLREENNAFALKAYSGQRMMKKGESAEFIFSLLITPLKLIDTEQHFNDFYYHAWYATDMEEAKEGGATVVNIHQGGRDLPNINYPLSALNNIKALADKAHDYGMKLKIYDTVRELSNFIPEFWAFRSLGDEIYLDGPGFMLADQFENEQKKVNATGGPWLNEHAIDGFIPAWHQNFPDGTYDEAIAETGLSRRHNHYIESIGYLARTAGIDGVYLDGIGFDRKIAKRLRKVLDDNREGCLIDFHSGNNFPLQYGNNNPIVQYMEHIPFLDRIWFGEGYDYNKSHDYYLIEISGIPFGIMGDMLADGNPYRGMLYGMMNRWKWCNADPRPIRKALLEFGISKAKMFGYWVPDCPVKTNSDEVLATVYLKSDSALVAIASWSDEPTSVTLQTTLTYKNIRAPHIENFQKEAAYTIGEPIHIEPGSGALLVLS